MNFGGIFCYFRVYYSIPLHKFCLRCTAHTERQAQENENWTLQLLHWLYLKRNEDENISWLLNAFGRNGHVALLLLKWNWTLSSSLLEFMCHNLSEFSFLFFKMCHLTFSLLASFLFTCGYLFSQSQKNSIETNDAIKNSWVRTCVVSHS